MEEFKLNAEPREKTGNQVGVLRREGNIPAVVYGPGIDNYNVSLNRRDLEKVYEDAGESTLIDMTVGDKKPVKVIVQAIQRHPLKHQITHVDLRQVKMDEAITATVALELVGEAPAVKTHGALMMHNLDSVEVRCLPTALVSQIEVDLSKLEDIGDGITIGNVTPPEGIEILTEPDVSVVIMQAPKMAEEEDEKPAGEGEGVEGDEAAVGEGDEGKKEDATVAEEDKAK